MKDNKITSIIKRDGRVVAFEKAKLVAVIAKAGSGTGEFQEKEAKRLAEIVVVLVDKSLKENELPQVEKVQDIVEQVLMAAQHFITAKAYILYRQARSEQRRVERLIGVTDDLDLPAQAGLSVNQLKVLESRYLLKDEEGRVVETPSEMFRRVAKTLAAVEKNYKASKAKIQQVEDDFYQVMSKLEFLPAGRTLNNAGTLQSQLASCFVLPVEDSMEGIFDALKWMALVHQTGGGTGFNFSKLRPKGDAVTKSTGGFATGPISFMKVFDTATRQVMQGGKKRGANMGILNIDHPDILEFINCKNESGEIENFNLSIGVSDLFMKAVEKNIDWELKNPRTKETVQTMKARSLMSQVSAMAWRTGDPGLVFLDTINRNNPLKKSYGLIEATNPCGEQPLHPFDACNLGSINLAVHVVKTQNPHLRPSLPAGRQGFGGQATVKVLEVDWRRLEHTVRVGVRMLDNVVDACKYPLPQITNTVRANRRIGLGVMGWAEMLYQLRVPYNSKEGVELALKVAKFIQDVSWKESEKLSREKGAFLRWKESSFAKSGKKVRNMAITTIAPTGSISMLADCSGGIEPVFALVYTKNVLEEAGLSYVNKYFNNELQTAVWADGDPEHKVRDRIVREVASAGSIRHVSGVPREVIEVYQTAHDITPEWHVKMQAAWQKYTDNAVSKTINFPSTGTIEEVMKAYLQAWRAGCKGITIYRDGSKDGQILSVGTVSNPTSSSTSLGAGQIIQSKIKIETLKQRIARGGQKTVRKELCPECEAKLVIEEGCAKCYGCGYSVCQG